MQDKWIVQVMNNAYIEVDSAIHYRNTELQRIDNYLLYKQVVCVYIIRGDTCAVDSFKNEKIK